MVSDCFDLTDKMVQRKARMPLSKEHGKYRVELTEPGCADSSVTIRHLPDRCIVIKLDSCVDLNAIFNGSLGECKRSDYVIVADHRGELVVVYIEMKRTKAAWKAVCQQLSGSHCFIQYMQTLGKTFGKQGDYLQGAKHRFVCYGHTGPRKRKTKITRQAAIHDTPEKALKIDNPNYVQFAMIAGGK